MGNEEMRQRASELHQLIVGASTTKAWSESAGTDGRPQWQREVIAKILTLAYDQDIEYLSTAMPDGDDWDIIAFTNSSVVRVLVVRSNGVTTHTEATSFPRSSLESLELMDVASIPDDETPWPSELNMVGHYKSATVTLPLDRFASSDNKRALVRLLTSLLQDVAR